MDSVDNMFTVSSKLYASKVSVFVIQLAQINKKIIYSHAAPFFHRYVPIAISTFPRLQGIPGENVFTRLTENWKTLRNTLHVKVGATWIRLIIHT